MTLKCDIYLVLVYSVLWTISDGLGEIAWMTCASDGFKQMNAQNWNIFKEKTTFSRWNESLFRQNRKFCHRITTECKANWLRKYFFLHKQNEFRQFWTLSIWILILFIRINFFHDFFFNLSKRILLIRVSIWNFQIMNSWISLKSVRIHSKFTLNFIQVKPCKVTMGYWISCS